MVHRTEVDATGKRKKERKKGRSGIIWTNAPLLEERDEREIAWRKHEVISILGELLEGFSVPQST